MRTRAWWLVASILVHAQWMPAQWTETQGPDSVPVWCLASQGNRLFAGTAPGGPYDGGVFISTDTGASWIPASTGLTSRTVRACAVNGSSIFAGTYGGVFKSVNNGGSWFPANIGLTNSRVHSLAVSPVANESGQLPMYVGTYAGVFVSTNDGTTWNRANTGLACTDVMALLVCPTSGSRATSRVYAGTYGGGIFVSDNNGANWSAANTGVTNGYVNVLAASDSFIFAGTNGGGVLRSSDAGATWVELNAGLSNLSIQSLLTAGPDLFAATGAGVFWYATGGNGWDLVDSGFTAVPVLSLRIHENSIIAGTRGAGIWRCPFTQTKASGIEHPGTPLPATFELQQNYPNPFNAKTVISCQLSVAGRMELVVHDVLGREVTVLMDEWKEPGRHDVTWDASGCASGVYICRLIAGEGVQSRTMTLLK